MLQTTVDGAAVADDDHIAGAKALIEDHAGTMGPGQIADGRCHRCMLLGPDPNNHLEGFAELAQGVLNDGLEVEGAPGHVFADDVARHVEGELDNLHPGPGHQVILHSEHAGDSVDGRRHIQRPVACGRVAPVDVDPGLDPNSKNRGGAVVVVTADVVAVVMADVVAVVMAVIVAGRISTEVAVVAEGAVEAPIGDHRAVGGGRCRGRNELRARDGGPADVPHARRTTVRSPAEVGPWARGRRNREQGNNRVLTMHGLFIDPRDAALRGLAPLDL